MITPISLENDITVITHQLDVLKKQGIGEFHIDIIDGLFADNVTVSPADLQVLNFAPVAVDLHLLVDDPTEWIEECVALQPARIFAQVERMGNVDYFVEAVRGYGGVAVGLGLDLFTPIDSLPVSAFSYVDAILLMSVQAGYSGQKFDERVIAKITELRQKFDGKIVIDGGITPQTYSRVLAAGADEAAANSALWKGDFSKNWQLFKTVDQSLKGDI